MADKERPEVLERLRSAIDKAGGVGAIALKSGIKERTLSRYLSAGSRIPAEAMFALSRATNTGLEWLMSGIDAAKNGGSIQSEFDSISLPLLNVLASAGVGTQIDGEHEIQKLPFSRALLRELGARPEKCHFIRARGDSMEPTIHDGDVVLIDTGRSKDREDGIFVLMFGDDARIKRCFFGAFGQLTLVSDNPAYPDEVLDRGQREQIKIVGKVIWVGGGV